MSLTLYPSYKEAAKYISEDAETFFLDSEIAILLEEELQTDKYRFALMKLQAKLLDEYGINFIRSENEKKGKGYKKATDTETVEVTAQRLHRKFYSTANKQNKILGLVDRSKLSEETSETYDRHCVKNGLMRAFLSKTPLNKCLSNTQVKIDVPQLI